MHSGSSQTLPWYYDGLDCNSSLTVVWCFGDTTNPHVQHPRCDLNVTFDTGSGFEAVIYNPSLVPPASFSVLVGFLGCLYILRKTPVNYQIYSLMFFLFGCMNTFGIIYHCLYDQTKIPYGPNQFASAAFWFQNLDGIFSSSVDFSFALCGLVDAGVLSLSNKLNILFIAFVYLFIVIAYALCMCWPPIISPTTVYQSLYLDAAKYGSITYFVLQLVWFASGKAEPTSRAQQIFWLASSLGIGLFGLTQGKDVAYPTLCEELGPYLAAAFWYTCSGLSLFCLLMYYTTGHRASKGLAGDEAPKWTCGWKQSKPRQAADASDITRPLLQC